MAPPSTRPHGRLPALGSGVSRRSTAGAVAARVLLGVGLLSLLLALGWAIAGGHARLFGLAAVAAALCALAISQRGAFVGLMLLAAMNGVPYFDASRIVASKYTFEDAAIIALLLVTAAWLLAGQGDHRPSRAARTVSRAGAALLLWWILIVGRSVTAHDVSLTHAASFGRDFGFFAALLVLLPRVRLRDRDIGVLLSVLLLGVLLYATGQVMTAVGAGNAGSLIHYHYTLDESGVTRVYANMTDLVTAGLAISLAACLLARGRVVRLLAAPTAILLTTSTVLQLTRARWLGVIVGLVLATLWLLLSDRSRASSILRRRSVLAVGALVLGTLVMLLAAPGILSGGTVVHRLLSIFSDIQGSGTVATRERVTSAMTAYLGEKWPTGLGFVPPGTHYVQSLPEGSIRDSDVGVLNAVMTMGVVGAALVYLPVLTMLGFCLRRGGGYRPTPFGWLRFGGTIWLISTLFTSITLVTLFSPSGLAMSAVLIALLTNRGVLTDERAEVEAHAPARTRAGRPEYEPLTA
jgi:hypothetical protein